MIKQDRICTHLPKAIVFDFMRYKKRKPFFKRSSIISIGSPIDHTYVMLKNVVYRDKQILALKSEDDPNTILFVEAVIECGQLKEISKIPEAFMADLIRLFKDDISEGRIG